MKVKRAESAAGRRLAWSAFSSPSKRIFVLVLFLSSGARAQREPKVALERVVDGRGNRFCEVATATAKAEGVTRSARVVRGLLRDDLVLTFEAVGSSARLYTISLGGGAPLRFETSGSGGRVTVSSPVSTFRYFEPDLGLRTVRCNLSRLADEANRDLLRAAADYMEQGLEDDGLSPEELPVLALAAAVKRPPPAVPPTRRTVPWTDGGAEADDLAASARAAMPR
jgi:hypothetical protein